MYCQKDSAQPGYLWIDTGIAIIVSTEFKFEMFLLTSQPTWLIYYPLVTTNHQVSCCEIMMDTTRERVRKQLRRILEHLWIHHRSQVITDSSSSSIWRSTILPPSSRPPSWSGPAGSPPSFLPGRPVVLEAKQEVVKMVLKKRVTIWWWLSWYEDQILLL